MTFENKCYNSFSNTPTVVVLGSNYKLGLSFVQISFGGISPLFFFHDTRFLDSSTKSFSFALLANMLFPFLRALFLTLDRNCILPIWRKY